jgi:NADPH-dependent 2,4-dienoyl-CoA reductase/sulfur reductase-like enzyme
VKEVLVVGAGLAGLNAVEALRHEGYDGRITLLGDEDELPYDRPPLSKELLVGAVEPETVFLRTPEQLAALDVTLRTGTTAESLDLRERVVVITGGERLHFDALVIATGSRPRTIPVLEPRPGVQVLRTLADSLRLSAELDRASHLVVVGAGFIGSEVAASARTRGLEVTIVEQAPAPLARVLGVDMGALCAGLHADHGTQLLCGVTVDAIEGSERVEAVRLSDGRRIDAGVVVVGIGVVPNTEWLEGSGLQLDDGIVCDATLAAGHPGVYAVGDIARWPNELFDERMRVEQWTNAAEQGRHVAAALLRPEAAKPFRGSNYFWSDQYGLRIQFTGVPIADEALVVAGTVDERKFAAWYRSGDRLVGALTMDSLRLARRSKLLIERGASWSEALASLEA